MFWQNFCRIARLSEIPKLNVIFASSEVFPFAKTGGLADVSGTLPLKLRKLGQDVTVFMPAYKTAVQSGQTIEYTGINLEVPIGGKRVKGALLRSQLPNSDVTIYLVQQDDYFNRAELYTENAKDYKDNCERFVFYCRAVLNSVELLSLHPDIIHCNDWQTGLIPAYLKTLYVNSPKLRDTASLQTIHNIAYQGSFWHWDMLLTGLDWKYYNWRQMEHYNRLNLLKTGIVFADSINAVSPTYAEEIQTQSQGYGLESALKHRNNVLSGIINGVDYDVWNPETDPILPENYSVAKCKAGKDKCKAALQEEFRLPQEPDRPLIGLIGRLADQKGWNLIAQVMHRWVNSEDAQWAILGTGDPDYQEMLFKLSSEFPMKVAARLNFSDDLAHRIEAGADMFVMPSRFEPCGLNQLYSLKYGTVPIVRRTGGLADTITDATEENLTAGTANGFSFRSYDAASLERALHRAYDMYHNDKKTWRQLIRTGMRQDWSWTKSASHYIELYEKTIERRKGYQAD